MKNKWTIKYILCTKEFYELSKLYKFQFWSLKLCACWVTQSCLTLCKPMDYTTLAPLYMGLSCQDYLSGLPFPTPGDLPDPGITPTSPALQVNSLQFSLQGSLWVWHSISEISKLFEWVKVMSLLATPWNVAHHFPLLMEFSRQEYWSG